MPFTAGDVFADYTIVRPLGVGGMGAVYLVRHPRLPQFNAMKVLRPEFSDDPDFARRFQREAETVASLSHRNIVPVLDRGEEDGQLWLTMPFIEGIDAEQALDACGGLMPADRAVRIVAEVAGALDSAHRRGVLHRDVKPANILLTAPTDDDEREHVFLTDFGIAKPLDAATQLTRTGMVVATFTYASPEQIESRPLDARSDVYSLGCVLYRLLTGRMPFPGETVAAAVVGHLTLPPPRPSEHVPGLPRALDTVITRALAKDPAERYPSCRALATAAMDALAHAPAPDRPAPETTTRRGATLAGTARRESRVPAGTAPPTAHRPTVPPPDHGPPAPEPAPSPAPEPPPRRWLLVAVAAVVLVALVAGGLTWLLLKDQSGGAAAGSTSDGDGTSGPPAVLRFRPVIQLEAAGSAEDVGASAAPTEVTDPNAPGVTQDEAAVRFAALTCDSHASSTDRPQDYVAACSEDGTVKYLLGPAIIDGTGVVDASATTQQTTGEWVIELTFDDATQATWSEYTASHVGEQVAFTVDGQVVSAPTIQSAITGDTTISGSFTEESAKQLARQLGG